MSRLVLPVTFTVAVFIVASWIGVPVIVRGFVADAEEAALVGDAFGSINALFTGLSVAGVVAALLMQAHQLKQQGEQLKLQQDELRLQREEMKMAREEMMTQTSLLTEQAESLRREETARVAASDPEFGIRERMDEPSWSGLRINNSGGKISDVAVDGDDCIGGDRSRETLSTNETITLRWPKGTPIPIRFRIRFTNSTGSRRLHELEVYQDVDGRLMMKTVARRKLY